MPVLYFLKNPRSTLALKGQLDRRAVKEISKSLGPVIVGLAADNKQILIPTKEDCNLAYIKEISQKEFDDAQEELKKQQEEKKGTTENRIVRPEFRKNILPGGKKKR